MTFTRFSLLFLLLYCIAAVGCASMQQQIAAGVTLASGLGETTLLVFNDVCENIAEKCAKQAVGEEEKCEEWKKCSDARDTFLKLYELSMTAFETAAALSAADKETEAKKWYIKALGYLDKLKAIAIKEGFVDNLFQLVKQQK